jgi:putative endopeptidase
MQSLTLRAPALVVVALSAVLATAAPLAAQQHDAIGLDVSGMDTTVRAGVNFYRYANGGWDRTTEIPAERNSVSASIVSDRRTREQLAALIREDAAARGGSADRRRIGAFYNAFQDTATIAARGISPIRPLLDSIAKIGDAAALARFFGAHLRADVDVLNSGAMQTENVFGLWVDANFTQPTRNAAILLQGGAALPDRSYYIDSSSKMVAIRGAYRAHVARLLALAGVADTAAMADAVLALETKLARAHSSQADSWDPVKGNNRWARADFRTKAPGLRWEEFFRAARLADIDTLVAWQPGAIAGISALVASEPLASWRALLTYHAVMHRAAELPSVVDREQFAFFGRTLNGAQQQASRADRAVQVTNTALGYAVGRDYVARYFPASAKTRARRMVTNIVAAFDRRIDRLSWMAPTTRAEAKAKLRTLEVGIGYPDRWPSYDGLRLAADDAYGNAERLERFQYEKAIAALHEPLDRTAWVMTPQTINAVNMPQRNALNFPAAILQPPYFDPASTDAMNYGAMGAIIGHEVSHSFDNLGAAFDSRSRLRNWWTPSDSAHFAEVTGQLVRQYDAYKPLPDLAVNGQLTLAENIADLAGLTASYDAWRASLGGKRAPVVGGLTGDQQFFLSWAQSRRMKLREAALRRILLTNGHAPSYYRALTVRNLDAWYDAFGVRQGDSLYLAPAERVRIW